MVIQKERYYNIEQQLNNNKISNNDLIQLVGMNMTMS